MYSSRPRGDELRGRSPGRSYDDRRNYKRAERPLEGLNSLPTRISGALTQEQLSAYQTMFRISEITHELRSSELKPPTKRNRSPSPPPAYDSRGKRINTREQRYRRKLEEERHRLVEIVLKMVPHFVAPEDYKRPVKFQDKYYIPVDQYPGINFVGLLLGPRGNTLKKLQEESECKIAIRGRGSVKEGKNAHDLPKGAMNFSDPLHCLIIADTEEKIQRGFKACENIIVRAVTSPEGQNDLKRGQLRELAELNGTLREDKRPCNACGLPGHKNYECPNVERTSHKSVQCRKCGQYGHIANDCIEGGYAPMQQHQDNRYSRFSASREPHWQDQIVERTASSHYNGGNQGISTPKALSYKSRFSRENSTESRSLYTPGKIDCGIKDHEQDMYNENVVHSAPPPGMESSIPQPVDFSVPGMTPSVPGVPLLNPGSAPPGLDFQPTVSIPNNVSNFQPLSGPPGFAQENNENGSAEGLQGPPGF